MGLVRVSVSREKEHRTDKGNVDSQAAQSATQQPNKFHSKNKKTFT